MRHATGRGGAEAEWFPRAFQVDVGRRVMPCNVGTHGAVRTLPHHHTAGFTSWFKEEYGEAYVPLEGVKIDHLYIDVNSLLHTALEQGAFQCI
jgi:hypothetical protein